MISALSRCQLPLVRSPVGLRVSVAASLTHSRSIVHGSQKPAADANIDFGALGLQFPPTKVPELVVKGSFWTPPPAAGEKPVYEDIPFSVDRTEPGKGLPVYTDYKGGGTKVVTVLRKVRGDMDVLRDEMMRVCDGENVELKLGKLIVTGNYNARLKMWLTGLGF